MNFRTILLILVTTGYPVITQATESSWYDVEILLFKRNIDIKETDETLNQSDTFIKRRQRIEIIKANEVVNCSINQICLHQKNPVQLTNDEIANNSEQIKRIDNKQFNDVLLKLEQHLLFTPLLHVTLRMPIYEQKKTLPLHIFAGQNYALDLHKAKIMAQQETMPESEQVELQTNKSIIEQPTKIQALVELEKTTAIRDLYEVDGNFFIYDQQGLNISSQLIIRTESQQKIELSSPQNMLQKNNKDKEQSEEIVQIFDLQPIVEKQVETEKVITETLFDQKLAITKGDINYFDHPLFGMLVQVQKPVIEEIQKEVD